MDQRHHPALGALRAFEAAMRHGGLAAAAEELRVTPSAVSHQIRALEADLGVALTRRAGRGLAPTAAGEALLPGLREGFGRIVEAVAELRRRGRDGPLTVSMIQTFALHWFVPRMPAFERRHPDIPVRLQLTSRPADFAREEVDVAIRYGAGGWPGLRADLLFRDEMVPICSPALLAEGPPLREPADLAHRTLLASTGRREAWPAWLEAAGAPGLEPARTQYFDTTNVALQAAARGLGVAIAGRRIVRSLIEARWIVTPFRTALPDPNGYFVVYPEARAGEPRVRALRDWLLAEAAAEA